MKFAVVFAAVLAVAAAAPVTSWTLQALSSAIQNPATPAFLLPYLQEALNQKMLALFADHNMDSITVATPDGLVVPEAVYEPLPLPALVPEAVYEPQPLPAVVAPTVPSIVADAQGNPLVQIIVNILAQSDSVAAAPAPVPAPVVDAEMEPEAVYEPLPLPPVVVPEAVYDPQPLPVVIPEAVPEAVYEPQPLPEAAEVVPEVPDSVAIMPVVPGTNPIDVIAVAAPDANPIDLLQPTPVVVAGAGQGILV